MGEGPSSVSLPSTRHNYQPEEVISSSTTDCDLPRDGDREPLFEGFSFPGESFDPAPCILPNFCPAGDKASSVLALSVGSPVVCMPSSPKGSTSHEVSAGGPTRPLVLS